MKGIKTGEYYARTDRFLQISPQSISRELGNDLLAVTPSGFEVTAFCGYGAI